MKLEAEERLNTAYHIDHRPKPTEKVTITKARGIDVEVLCLTKKDVFKLEIWATCPTAELNEGILKHVLSAGSTMELIPYLKRLAKRVRQHCSSVAVGVQALDGPNPDNGVPPGNKPLFLFNVIDTVSAQWTRSKTDLLNQVRQVPFHPSLLLLEWGSRPVLSVDVFYLFRTQFSNPERPALWAYPSKVMTRHFGWRDHCLDWFPENDGSLLPTRFPNRPLRNVPYVRVGDVGVLEVDDLLVQMSAQMLWGPKR